MRHPQSREMKFLSQGMLAARAKSKSQSFNTIKLYFPFLSQSTVATGSCTE